MNVYICEDDSPQRKRLEKTIQNYILMENIPMSLVVSSGQPEDVLDYLANHRRTSLYFLDVDLNHKINGIELAVKIRQYDPHGIIVFTTTHAEMTHLTFKYRVEAMDYILKDESDSFNDRVIACIHEAHQRIILQDDALLPRFIQKSGDRVISIPFNEILFFESGLDHRIIVHSKNRRAEFYGNLKDLETCHPSMFRCHTSYVINVQNIETLNQAERTITFTGGLQCPVSVRNLKRIKDKLDLAR